MMRFLLEKNGFSVIGAENGRLEIDMALQHKPRAILLDIQLPEMDGYAVAEELKKILKWQTYRLSLLHPTQWWGIVSVFLQQVQPVILKSRLIRKPLWRR
jgi:CheY-like chemotaxis protein